MRPPVAPPDANAAEQRTANAIMAPTIFVTRGP
jgi:hypothetical protein